MYVCLNFAVTKGYLINESHDANNSSHLSPYRLSGGVRREKSSGRAQLCVTAGLHKLLLLFETKQPFKIVEKELLAILQGCDIK